MQSLTAFALRNRTLILTFALLALIAGPLSFTTHPSREDPKITIRTALVSATFEGMSPERMENLITRKIEEKIREIAEVEHIESTVQNGSTIVRAQVYETYSNMDSIWIDLRNKMDDLKSELPEGTKGPVVNDDYGEVAMATIAMTAEGFSIAEMREAAKQARNKLYTVSGIKEITLFGVEPERIFVEFDNIRLVQFGIAPSDIVSAVDKQNIILPGGQIQANGQSFFVEPTGNFKTLRDIENLPINIPGKDGQVVYLKDLAKISRGYADPPSSPVFYNGKPAIVISVSMIDQFDSFDFAEKLKAKVSLIEQSLPIGYQLSYITFQPDDIRIAVSGVMNNLYQTVGIVLVVVMLFLGWRTGLLVGAMVPLVMLLSILIMRILGIELERMSLATLIISLGLLVDNGIVMAEEISRRLTLGEERLKAVQAAGREMAFPLLSSSLTTVFAFMPLMLADSTAGEYTRSISLVIAISLLGSWVVAMTVMPVFCYWFLKAGAPVDEAHFYDQPFYRRYRGFLTFILSQRTLFLIAVLFTLFGSLYLFRFVPKVFFPSSERTQLQIIIDAPVGSNSYTTLAAIKPLSNWLMDKEVNPSIINHVAYVANGGPRFYLGLDPIDPDPFRAYMIANVKAPEDIAPLLERVREFGLEHMPGVRVTPKPMSMGPGEAGLVEYRIVGPQANVLKDTSDKIMAAMRAVDETRNIKDNWENLTVKIIVDIDQARARRVGVTSEQVANALQANLAGSTITGYREGDQTIPVILREQGTARKNIDRLRTLNIAQYDGTPIPLLQIATFRGEPEYALMQRRNLERYVKVSAVNKTMTAAELDAALAGQLNKIEAALPSGYRIETGGELEDSSKAQGALFAYMPLAFALILLVLVAQFDSYKRPLIIVLTIPLVMIGVAVTLLLAPGANFGFMAILGLLALAGIVLNNAIVLIDRIEIERADGAPLNTAIITASVTRFKPIVMTTATTAVGLMPLIISQDVLFYDLALVIAGGMVVGTVLTLAVVPVLYSLFFGRDDKPIKDDDTAGAESSINGAPA